MCWENYFAKLIMKVIGKRKPFKTTVQVRSWWFARF